MEQYSDPNLKIFALSSNRPLAQKIADQVGVELGKVSVTQFSDGEIKINIDESIRGDHVYIVQSTSYPVNDNLMELLIMIDALRRASAKTINVVLPYYGYSRQDRKAQSREPITAKLVANMITQAGADRVLTLDLHAAQIQGFFDIPVDHLLGAPLLANYFLENNFKDKDIVVVSPDHGGVTRARKLAEFLHAPIAIIDKRRPKANVSQVMHIIGDVSGRDCILVDDMIDTGGTLVKAAEALKERGATKVVAYATHAVLSGTAAKNLANPALDEVVVTDTIPLSDEIKALNKVRALTLSSMLAEAIRRISNEESISAMFDA